MIHFKKLAVMALFASSTLSMSNHVYAAELNNSFNVKLAITTLCTVDTVNDVDFGLVNSDTPTQTQSTKLNIKCNMDQPYTVALQPSNNDGKGAGVMTGAVSKDTMAYQITSDVAGTVPFGTGTNAVSLTGDGLTQTLPVYVTVDNSEFNKPADNYNDIVSVSIKY